MNPEKRYRNNNPRFQRLINGYFKLENLPGRGDQLLDQYDYNLLSVCYVFRSLKDHCKIFLNQYKIRDREDKIIERLETFVKQGTLIEEESFKSEFLKNISGIPQTEESQSEIPVIGIPTANRPLELDRLFSTLIPNLKKFGHMPEIVIADDSTQENLQKVKELAEKWRKEFKGSIIILDFDARKKMSQDLSGRCKADKDITEFALCGDDTKTTHCGALRNAIFLSAAGKKILMVDDDVIIRTHVEPTKSKDLLITGSYSNGYSYFGSYEDAISNFPMEEIDFLGIHEKKLGKNISEIFKEYKREDIKIDSLPGGISNLLFQNLKNLDNKDAKVLLTHFGSIGHNWMRFNSLFDCNPVNENSLFGKTKEQFESNKETPFVSRVDPTDTLYQGSTCVSLNVGIDGRDILPPFPPLYRGQDNVFGYILNKCVNKYFCFRLPVAVEHKRNEARKRNPETLAYLGALSSITRLAVNTYVSNGADSIEESLLGLGKHFIYLSSISATEIEVLIRNEITKSITNTCSFARLLKAHYSEMAPSWWKEDMDKLIASERETVNNVSEFKVFTDIPEWDSQSESGWIAFQAWLKKYGEVISLWPLLFSASKNN